MLTGKRKTSRPVTYKGKIGTLPYSVREELNRRIRDGIRGVDVLAWLNSLEVVNARLNRYWNGRPVIHSNLSDWRATGYADWLREMRRTAGSLN